MTMDTDGKVDPELMLKLRLRTIAEWPITNPHENMDAVNMRKMAMRALGFFTDRTPPASVESADAGESDAAFVERMGQSLEIGDTMFWTPTECDRLLALAHRALTHPSTSPAAGGTDDGGQAERERLRKLMWDHALTLPISQRAAWIEPMGVVRRGRFLTNQEKLQNLAEGLDMPLDQLTSALARDPAALDRAPDLPGTPAPSAMPGPAVSEAEVGPWPGEWSAPNKIGSRVHPAFTEAVRDRLLKESTISLMTVHLALEDGHRAEAAARVRASEPAAIERPTSPMAAAAHRAGEKLAWQKPIYDRRRAPESVRHGDAKGEAVAWQWVIGDPPWTCVSADKASIDRLVARHGGACAALSYFDRLEPANPILPTAPAPAVG